MKRFTLLIVGFIVAQLFYFGALGQGINSGNPSVPFGSKTSYPNGIMPTNLPTNGTYGRSQDAADAYNFWVGQFVESCSDGSYRVKFDNAAQTVSEGIAYGMLLSVYAGDKVRFDGFWKFYKKSMNSHGVMNWMTDGCNGNARDNGATDAELDAAMALIIADKQWPNATSPYKYIDEAKTLIGNIKTYEIHPSSYQTLNGDAWGTGNSCRNPSYQAPAYYREFAKVDVANATFWNNVVAASESLIAANRNSTTGLVGNWCDPNGVSNACANTTPNEYGSDACRNPWRMATDVIWNGSSTASVAYNSCSKLSNWLKNYESNLRGPMAQNAANPGVGSYKNGSYTTFSLAPMAMSSTSQSSLNTCYTNVAGLPHDYAYFNETIRTLTLFVLSGNFWSPAQSGVISAPEFLSATTNDTGTEITISFTKAMTAPASNQYSSFTLKVGGVTQTGKITAITTSGTDKFILSITAGTITAGKTVTLSYTPGTIKSADNVNLAAFTDKTVKNALVGNSTNVDNCEDNNWINFMGGVWFTYDDSKASDKGVIYPGASTITPLTSPTIPFTMTSGGNGGSNYSAHITYSLNAGQWIYEPFVGIGVTLDPESRGDVQIERNLSGSTGVSFWHKGAACLFQPIMTDNAFHQFAVSASTVWQFIEVPWSALTQPSWATQKPYDPTKTLSLQWQVKGATNADKSSGEVWIDDVVIEGFVPVPITNIALSPTSKTLQIDEEFQILPTFTPVTSVYKELAWLSSDPTIATVNDTGLVVAKKAGIVSIQASSKKDPDFKATCVVTVQGPIVLPTSVSVAPATSSVGVGGTVQLTTTVLPADATDKTVTWSSSNTAIATVSSSGFVTGVAIGGPVTITATSVASPTVKGTATITVVKTDVTGITVDQPTVTLTLGESATVVETIEPANATNKSVTWSTSNAAVATVTNGVINSTGVGTCTITVTSVDNPLISADVAVTVNGVAVTSVSVTPTAQTILVGGSVTLTPTVLPANATQTVTYTSSNTAVATVSPAGVVTGVSVGSATITVASTSDGTKTATSTITVDPVLVSSITITPATATVSIGATTTLTASVLPANATDKTYTWASSNTSVATVDQSGVVTGVAAGSANITATANDGSLVVGTCAVTVSTISVSSITITPATATINIGATTTLTASVLPANATDKTYTWASSNTSVATVDQSGVVTGVAAGSADITATANDGSLVVGTCAVTVTTIPVTSITITPATASINIGATTTLTASVLPANATDKTYTWASSNTSVATVDQSGVVTGVAAGSASITATANDGSLVVGTCAVTVTTIPVTSITITPATATINIGATTTLTASVLPANATDKTYTWASSNTSVATVDQSGVVTGVAAGSASITATANDGSLVVGTCAVTVNAILPTAVTTSNAIGFVTGGASQTLTATITPANATDKSVTWTSSNTSVATVNPTTGEVTPVGVGTCTITVTCTAAPTVTASCTVTVDASVTNVTSVSLDNTTLSISIGGTATLIQTVLPIDATDKSVTWSSSNSSIVSVSNGVVTGEAIGSATITVTTTDGGFTAICDVTVSAISVTGVTLTPATLSLSVSSAAQQLTATVEPENATNKAVTYSSSNTSVVTVSPAGVVSVQGIGTATVTVTTTDGSFTDVCDVVVSAIPVTTITLDQTTLNLTMSSNPVALTTTVEPTNASDKTISWSSSNTSVATVSLSGVVSPVGIGTAIITATANDGSGIEASCNVTVSSVPVTGVTVLPTTLSLAATSAAQQLTATVLPADASNKAVTWSSSNTSVVTVSPAGVVSVVGIGTADVTVTTTDGNYTAICAVTVSSISVTGITLSPNTLNLTMSSTAQLITATVLPADASDKSLTWSSSNTSVATVNQSGVVSPVGLGSAIITATANDGSGISSNCDVLVSAIPVSGVNVDKTSLDLVIGGAVGVINATVLPAEATNKNVTWSSNSTSVATVVDGVVTPVSAGTAIITVTTVDGNFSKNVTVNVSNNVVNVTSVTVSPSTVSIQMGQTATLTATVSPSNATNKNVTWASSNSSIATVNASGVVTPVSVGTVMISVTTEQGSFVAYTNVTVTDILATSVVVTNALSLNVGATGTLVATVYPSGAAQTVTWSSSNTSVATVSSTGVVTALAAGAAVITVTTTDGTDLKATSDITVSTVPVSSVTISPVSIILEVGQSPVTITATVEPANATNKSVTWSSSDLTIATVNSVGVVTPVAAGKSAITVRTVDAGIARTCSVEVVSKVALTAKVNEAQALYDAAQEGTAIGQYKVGSKATLLAAIAAANTVKNGTTNTQVQINAAQTALSDAITNFKKQIITDGTLVFDAEHENMTLLKSYWFSYNDNGDLGASVVTPLATKDIPFEMSSPGRNGAGSAAKIHFVLDKGDFPYDPFVGMGMSFNAVDSIPYDLTGSTGFSFWHKGSAVAVSVALATVKDADYHSFAVPAHADWTLVELTWEEMKQAPTWGVDVAWDPSIVTKLQWQVQGATGTTGDVWVDDVTIKGISLDLPSLVVKDALEALISDAQDLHDGSIEGVENGQYEVGSKADLQAAIDIADAVFANENASQETVDQATKDLQIAIDEFESRIIGSVNKTDLIIAIIKAETIAEFAPIGTSVGEYPQSAYDLFLAEIELAKVVRDNNAATVSEVLKAISDLEAAIVVFKESVLGSVVDRSSLENLISTASLLVDYAENGIFKGDYPQFAIDALKASVWDATVVYNLGNATQAEVDQAYEDLLDALTLFESFRGKTSVEEVADLELNVYPNPTVNQITISASVEISEINIISVSGAVISKISVAQKEVSVDLSNIAVGEYIVIVKTIDGTKTQSSFTKK